MYSTRLIHLLMVALSVSSVTGVAWLDPQHPGMGHQLEFKRQDDPLSLPTVGSGSTATDSAASASSTEAASSSTSAADSSTSSAASTTDEPTSSSTSTADNTTPTSTTQQTTPTSTTAPGTTTGGTTTSHTASSTSTSTGGATTDGSDTSTAAPSTTAPPSTSTFVTIVTTTDSQGHSITTSSSSIVVSTPTAAADTSATPKTMNQQTKNVIIGVCVGVGGAIVLAAAGVLFWRLRSKRRSQEENEELVSYGDGFGGPGTAEKTEPAGTQPARSPFQSTLESYHAPTQTNAASNF
ncbi:hypothetical protein F4804DRAFT_345404 [Jackrogersella minutella]|nr:hypothetical protein F4804DRAFT_345404 [Jackrogersella minutella]